MYWPLSYLDTLGCVFMSRVELVHSVNMWDDYLDETVLLETDATEHQSLNHTEGN